MVDAGTTVYYRYVRPPCVYLAFPSSGKVVRHAKANRPMEACIDAEEAAAGPMCCYEDLGSGTVHSTGGFVDNGPECLYSFEWVRY